ncbi:MAG: inner membrane CreD family protein [Gammaproteobacteria bacterium]|nr:inner membrane CreD family protein [Gammaproteobacteria bacterium]
MTSELLDGGARLIGRSEDFITKQDVGLLMPERINPGPLAARISFFAPVGLLFFFVLIGAIGILRNIDIHPMHYLFVSAGFFAFHLLFAYLVDLINIQLAFALAEMASVVLVVSYLAAALGGRFPWKTAEAGQITLVVFSNSFFLMGMTGITVTAVSVITLAVLMRITAHLDWSQVFLKSKSDTAPKKTDNFETA